MWQRMSDLASLIELYKSCGLSPREEALAKVKESEAKEREAKEKEERQREREFKLELERIKLDQIKKSIEK